MEIELDLWPLALEMLPGLEEIERIEALAAGLEGEGSREPPEEAVGLP
jgi:hypothetical protein